MVAESSLSSGLSPSAHPKKVFAILSSESYLASRLSRRFWAVLPRSPLRRLIGEGGLCHLSAQISQLHLLQRPHYALSLPSLHCFLQQGGVLSTIGGSAAFARLHSAVKCSNLV